MQRQIYTKNGGARETMISLLSKKFVSTEITTDNVVSEDSLEKV